MDIIKIVARQYGIKLEDDQILNMSWSEKVKYLKMNPVTVARQIDYRFTQVFKNVILSGMHPIGEILNYDDRREFQGSGVEHCHGLAHVKDAPRVDIDSDDACTAFVDKYISCSLPDKGKQPELNALVSKLQTHHHTSTCRKQKGVTCRFHAPWPPTEQTLISRAPSKNVKETVKKSKAIINKVLAAMYEIGNLDTTDLKEILEHAHVSPFFTVL